MGTNLVFQWYFCSQERFGIVADIVVCFAGAGFRLPASPRNARRCRCQQFVRLPFLLARPRHPSDPFLPIRLVSRTTAVYPQHRPAPSTIYSLWFLLTASSAAALLYTALPCS